jgi:hypothetical protein
LLNPDARSPKETDKSQNVIPRVGTTRRSSCRMPAWTRSCGTDRGPAEQRVAPPGRDRPHLFGRFFRAGNATEAGIKGTGLGLAVTKTIVEAHGGTITVVPAPGGGTRFTVHFPAMPELSGL